MPRLCLTENFSNRKVSNDASLENLGLVREACSVALKREETRLATHASLKISGHENDLSLMRIAQAGWPS